MNPFGEISAGYFYKYLTNPIVVNATVVPNYLPPGVPQQYTCGWLITEAVNAGHTWIQGFARTTSSILVFSRERRRGWGSLQTTDMLIRAPTDWWGVQNHPRLLRNSPNTWNISPTYDRGRFSIRVGLSYNQANIYSYNYQDGTDGSTPTPGGLSGPFGDIYFYSHIQLDAQGSVRLAHGMDFLMYGLNLNNEVFGFYQGTPHI